MNKLQTDMKTIFKYFAAALVIVAAASCAKENATNDGRDESPVEMAEVSFTATIDSPSDPTTKTTLADDGLSVHWTEGDKIVLFPYTGTDRNNPSPFEGRNNPLTVDTGSISGKTTKFTGTAVSGSVYGAIYPYDAVDCGNCYGNIYTFKSNTLATQTAVPNNFSKSSWGVSNIAIALNVAKDDVLPFSNVLAHIKFTVSVAGVRTITLNAAKATGSGGLSDSYNLGASMNYRPATESFELTNLKTGITLTNSDSDFEVGTTYYVAIPVVEMEGFTMAGLNASSEQVFSFTKNSFKPERNTIYNVGSLGATDKDELTVSATNITIPAAGGSQTFTITANNDWTITSTQDWVNISPTSGSAGTHTITLSAEANTTGYNRNRAYIDVKSGSLTKSVTADQSMLTVVYSRGEQVSGADAMEDGASYVILRKGSTYDYLAFDNYGSLTVASISDLNDIPKKNIFVYHKDDSKELTSGTSYAQTSAGALQSLYNNGYIGSDLKVSNEAYYMTLGSHWGDTDPNIDIYKAVYTQNTGAFDYYQFISYVNSSISWKKGEEVSSSDLRKWYFYKVNAVSE